MSKYGRPVDHSAAQNGSDIRMIDVVEVPDPLPSWAANAAAWLAKQFPTLTGFVQIPDSIQPCAKYNGGGHMTAGNYTAPLTVTMPRVLDSSGWMEHAFKSLGKVALPNGTDAQKRAAGVARYGAIVKAVRASEVDAHAGADEAYQNAMRRGRFTKTGVGEYLTLISSLLVEGELTEIIGTWPTEAA